MKLWAYHNNISILIFYFTIKIISSVSFTFPSAVTLNNGNILVIEQLGIYIYDSTVSNLISTEYTFPVEDQIKTTQDLSRVVLKKKRYFILGLINYKIFFFNEQGKKLYNSPTKFITTEVLDYYTLVPIRYDSSNNYCLYVIGFIDSSFKLNLYLWKLYIITGQTSKFLKKFDLFETEDNNRYLYSFNFKK